MKKRKKKRPEHVEGFEAYYNSRDPESGPRKREGRHSSEGTTRVSHSTEICRDTATGGVK